MKKCELCNEATPEKGWRFCKDCRKVLMVEMAADGYLEPKIRPQGYRDSEAKENTYETKYGRDL